MIKYRLLCMECGELFDEPKTVYERHGLGTTPFEELNVCPFCESNFIVDAEYCDICNEAILDDYIITADEQYICQNC